MNEINEYRKVNYIELHATGIKIHAKEWSDALTLEDIYEAEGRKRFWLDGDYIHKLCQTLGIQTWPYKENNKNYPLYGLHLEIQELSPECEYDWIKEVWAKIDGPQQLSIKLLIQFEKNNKLTEEFEHITYHGPFTIYWLPEESE